MALITLRVLDGADRGRIYDEVPTPVTICREEGNTIQLNDERVSRYHLKIQEDHEKLVLTDLASTNGTKVNGEDIQLRILRLGDLIALGRSVLLFGSPQEIAARAGQPPENNQHTVGHDGNSSDEEAGSSLDYDLNLPHAEVDQPAAEPDLQPELPRRLSPAC